MTSLFKNIHIRSTIGAKILRMLSLCSKHLLMESDFFFNVLSPIWSLLFKFKQKRLRFVFRLLLKSICQYKTLTLVLIFLTTYEVTASLNKSSSSLQPRYVTARYCLTNEKINKPRNY